LKSNFAKCWTTVNSIYIPAVTHDEKSSFVASSIALFDVEHQMAQKMYANEELRWVEPFYLSIPVRMYYSVMYIVQVLRAKTSAGIISKSESSWLRNFQRRFTEPSCPIAGPLVPIFSNIVSVLPEDEQFQYVYPTIPKNGGYSTKISGSETKPTPSVDQAFFLIPSIPFIGEILHHYSHSQTIGDEDYDDKLNYVPFHLQTGGSLGGINFPAQSNDSRLNTSYVHLLHNPALMHPFPEQKSRLQEIHSYWKRSRISKFPVINTDTAYDPTSPGEYTRLGEDLDWFQPCLDMAVIQSKFFQGGTNLSTIPTVGGISSIIECNVEFKGTPTIPTTIQNWYPDLYESVHARFRSSGPTLPIEDQWQAAYCLTNVKLQWLIDGVNKIGSRASGSKTGPFWNNKKYNFMQESPVSVMNGTYTMIQTQFYIAKIQN